MFRIFAPCVLTLLIALVLAGCDSGSTPPPVEDIVTDDVKTYLQELPPWEVFSPTEPPQPPTPAGPAVTLPDTTMDVEVIQEDGSTEILPDMTYSCTSTPFTIQDTPEQIVMYSPDKELLYPGALIQGKSYAQGLGGLLGLPIAERAPIRVSIPGLANDDNTRTVETPNQASVDQAIGSMIGNATESGLVTPSTISFKMEEYHSESQFALSIKASGRYMNFEASASGEFSRNASETTVTAQFYQKMFEVVVEPPQTPDAFFSDEFTAEKLQEQIDLGRLGRDNLPVYVSNVVYGRMMMFSLTSTASEQEIRATLQAAYRNVNAEAEVELTAQQRSILRESKIAVASLGGDAEATLAVIRSGDWSQYFTENAPLSSAAPLSYTFRNLGDGSIARVTETTEYNIRSCKAQAANPGTYEFLAEQTLSLPIPTPVETHYGDVDGDGRTDLVFNYRNSTSGRNEVAVAFAGADGTYDMTGPITHPEQRLWELYNMRLGDIDGDGRADLIWAHASNQYGEILYSATSNGDGTFDFSDRMHYDPATPILDGHTAMVGDITGDDRDDIVWNVTHRESLGTHHVVQVMIATGNADGTFTFRTKNSYRLDLGCTPLWTLGHHDSDGRLDVIGNCRFDNRNVLYVGRGSSSGSILAPVKYEHHVRGPWDTFQMANGDVNGDGRLDYVWSRSDYGGDPSNPLDRIYVAPAQNGGFGFGSAQEIDIEAVTPDFALHLADVNGDGRDDAVWNRRDGAANTVLATLMNADGTVSVSRQSQSHEAPADWSAYRVIVADVNGSGREDIVWVSPAATTRIFVGLARDM